MAVLKWSLLCGGNASYEDFSLSVEDVISLIDERVPISYQNEDRDTARKILPIVVRLGGPEGIHFSLFNKQTNNLYDKKKRSPFQSEYSQNELAFNGPRVLRRNFSQNVALFLLI